MERPNRKILQRVPSTTLVSTEPTGIVPPPLVVEDEGAPSSRLRMPSRPWPQSC
jgi:hypothetical protein